MERMTPGVTPGEKCVPDRARQAERTRRAVQGSQVQPEPGKPVWIQGTVWGTTSQRTEQRMSQKEEGREVRGQLLGAGMNGTAHNGLSGPVAAFYHVILPGQ